MTVRECLAEGRTMLEKHRCKETDPGREAQALLCWAAGISREAQFSHPERRVTAPQSKKFRNALKRRSAHEPLELITGTATFLGREFRVTKATLIPRPATETLTEEVILDARSLDRPSFVDVGTGSGAIAITLAANFPAAHVLATDLSPAALAVARGNAGRAKLVERIAFIRADLLPPSPPRGIGTTVIVANLPYLPERSYPKLAPEVRLYEPRTALVSGGDGLLATKRLIDRIAAEQFDRPVRLYFELLPGQCGRVEKYAQKRLLGCQTARIINQQGVAIGVRISVGN